MGDSKVLLNKFSDARGGGFHRRDAENAEKRR